MHASALSELYWEVATSSYNGLKHLVTSFRADLIHERAELYASCIKAVGGKLDRCVGFMDGTKIQMVRPGGASTLQRSCYTGHKRFHCLVYQTITTPDGLILHLYGLVEGRQPDAYLYRQSGIDEDLRHHLVVDGKQYYLYADKAYVLRSWMHTAYPHPPMTPAHA
eukprot:IDg21988t1